MRQPRQKRILGMTVRELTIIAIAVVFIFCILIAFAGYVMLSRNNLSPVSVSPPTIVPQTIQVIPTDTLEWTATPSPQPAISNTSAPSPTLPPAQTQQFGTFNNPVPVGTGYTFPEFGTLTVLNSSWSAGQIGYAIVQLSFTCERPPDQECTTLYISLSAVGSSGNGYERSYDSAIPKPDFGSFMTHTYGGGADNGNAGFNITSNETSLLMRVELALGVGDGGIVFFRISS